MTALPPVLDIVACYAASLILSGLLVYGIEGLLSERGES